jgi:hypothetical protein
MHVAIQMSALGQKQTFALQQVMSALPPKADIGAAQINVRFVPIADIRRLASPCGFSEKDSCAGQNNFDFGELA